MACIATYLQDVSDRLSQPITAHNTQKQLRYSQKGPTGENQHDARPPRPIRRARPHPTHQPNHEPRGERARRRSKAENGEVGADRALGAALPQQRGGEPERHGRLVQHDGGEDGGAEGGGGGGRGQRRAQRDAVGRRVDQQPDCWRAAGGRVGAAVRLRGVGGGARDAPQRVQADVLWCGRCRAAG